MPPFPNPERVLTSWRQHPCALTTSAAALILPGIGVLRYSLSLPGTSARVPLLWLAVSLLLIGGWAVADWWMDQVVVTDQHVLRVHGILTRHRTVLPVAHITGMDCERSVVGRMLGYGDCVLRAAGYTQEPMRLTYVPRPDERYALLGGLLGRRVVT
ncbi:MAG: PH domain-containing protein [Egibacteraceae bacterium]